MFCSRDQNRQQDRWTDRWRQKQRVMRRHRGSVLVNGRQSQSRFTWWWVLWARASRAPTVRDVQRVRLYSLYEQQQQQQPCTGAYHVWRRICDVTSRHSDSSSQSVSQCRLTAAISQTDRQLTGCARRLTLTFIHQPVVNVTSPYTVKKISVYRPIWKGPRFIIPSHTKLNGTGSVKMWKTCRHKISMDIRIFLTVYITDQQADNVLRVCTTACTRP